MKDQYVGDVNDYRKYALLRHFGKDGLKIGVNWMLTPGDGSTDGNKREYLKQAAEKKWVKYDPELYTTLRQINSKKGSVKDIETGRLISGATFFSDYVPDRKIERKEWFGRAQAFHKDRDLVFFDPDNGFDIPSKPYGRKNSSKYVYREEVVSILSSGKSVLVYQHFNRTSRNEFLKKLASSVYSMFRDVEMTAFKTPHVAFLLFKNTRQAKVPLIPTTWDDDFMKAELCWRNPYIDSENDVTEALENISERIKNEPQFAAKFKFRREAKDSKKSP